MYSYTKDGITVTSMLDTRKANSNGEFPVKIRVNYKRIRNYYSIGKSMTREEWDNLPSSKSTANRLSRQTLKIVFLELKAMLKP